MEVMSEEWITGSCEKVNKIRGCCVGRLCGDEGNLGRSCLRSGLHRAEKGSCLEGL
jgi:hypothetical protein